MKTETELFPVTFGLLAWLQSDRKNPLVVGGEGGLKDAGELCFAFTRSAAEIVKMPTKAFESAASDFMLNLSPDEFLRIQAHAQKELLKFSQTSVAPKKGKPGVGQKIKR